MQMLKNRSLTFTGWITRAENMDEKPDQPLLARAPCVPHSTFGIRQPRNAPKPTHGSTRLEVLFKERFTDPSPIRHRRRRNWTPPDSSASQRDASWADNENWRQRRDQVS